LTETKTKSQEDELLLKLLVLEKGKKLFLRILNVISEPSQIYNVFALISRNLALFLVICSESSVEGLGSRVFLGFLSKLPVLTITQVGLVLRSVVEFHNDELLQHLLRSTVCFPVTFTFNTAIIDVPRLTRWTIKTLSLLQDGLMLMQHSLLHATVSLMQNPVSLLIS